MAIHLICVDKDALSCRLCVPVDALLPVWKSGIDTDPGRSAFALNLGNLLGLIYVWAYYCSLVKFRRNPAGVYRQDMRRILEFGVAFYAVI